EPVLLGGPPGGVALDHERGELGGRGDELRLPAGCFPLLVEAEVEDAERLPVGGDDRLLVAARSRLVLAAATSDEVDASRRAGAQARHGAAQHVQAVGEGALAGDELEHLGLHREELPVTLLLGHVEGDPRAAPGPAGGVPLEATAGREPAGVAARPPDADVEDEEAGLQRRGHRRVEGGAVLLDHVVPGPFTAPYRKILEEATTIDLYV